MRPAARQAASAAAASRSMPTFGSGLSRAARSSAAAAAAYPPRRRASCRGLRKRIRRLLGPDRAPRRPGAKRARLGAAATPQARPRARGARPRRSDGRRRVVDAGPHERVPELQPAVDDPDQPGILGRLERLRRQTELDEAGDDHLRLA